MPTTTCPEPALSRAAWPATVRIPGGRFRMGSEDGRADERPVRVVWVAAFAMGVTPVTCAQFADYLRATGAPPPPSLSQPDFADPEQPVTGVTWFEAVAYTRWLSERGAGRFRLPSEAEWERAARGGLTDAQSPWGASPPPGEIPDGPLRGPWRVGRGSPNAYGLFDMGTIVHEWCGDWYCAGASEAGAPEACPRRSSRGGSWRHHVRWSRPAARSSLPPEFRYSDYGLRVLEEIP